MLSATRVLQDAWDRFAHFSKGPLQDVRVFFAPGRVNLIGEHTDYNGGYVFPAALTMGTWVIVRPRTDGVLRFASTLFPQEVSVRTDDLRFADVDGFANYPKGTLFALADLGLQLRGGDFLYAGNLPHAAGLSSSASIEMATAVAANALADTGLDRVALVQAAQRAENEYLGLSSGIMDQFSVALGEVDRGLLLHCASLHYEAIPLALSQYQFVILNTCYQRGLTESKYNERFAECQQALSTLRRARRDLNHLADITATEWTDLAHTIADPTIRRRARHVVLENDRTLQAASLWKAGDASGFGQLMNESHVSLRDDYEVTGFALDAIVTAAWEAPGCLGARMTGAGFGGCAVALVERAKTEEFMSHVLRAYERSTGITGECYIGEIGAGAREVTGQL